MSSTLKVDILQDSGGNNLVTSNGSGVITAAGFGKIGQVVSATKTNTQSLTTTTFSDISDMSVSITPSSTSSKVLVFGYVNVAWDSVNAKSGMNLVRGSTNILVGDAAGSRIQLTGFLYLGTNCASAFPITYNFLDSPASTSAQTYKIQGSRLDGAGTVYINRSFNDTDNAFFGRTASTITAMEVLP